MGHQSIEMVWCGVLCCGSALMLAASTEKLFERPSMRQALPESHRTAPPKDLEARAAVQEAAARSARAQKRTGYQGEYLYAARLYFDAQRRDRAIALLDEVIASPGSASLHIEALRMKALFIEAVDPEAHRQALEECLRIWKAQPDRDIIMQSSLAQIVPMLEEMYSRRGEHGKAIEVNDLLARPDLPNDNEVRRAALMRRVSLLEEAGRLPEGVLVLESLLKEWPELCVDGDWGVHWRLKLAEWKYPDRASPERLEAVRSIWCDPKLADSELMIDVGYDLYHLQQRQGKTQDGCQTLRATIDKIDRLMATSPDSMDWPTLQEVWRRKLRTYLVVLGNAYEREGMYPDAMWAWKRYEALASTDEDRESARVVLRGLERRMKDKAEREAAAAGGATQPAR
jgi:tetratricopeptide (TPR) repeat protein